MLIPLTPVGTQRTRVRLIVYKIREYSTERRMVSSWARWLDRGGAYVRGTFPNSVLVAEVRQEVD